MTEEATGAAEGAAPEREKRKTGGRGQGGTAIRVVRVQGKAALVEYGEGGEPLRVTIPLGEIADDGKVQADVLRSGVPYGLPWEEAPIGKVAGRHVARALRNAGIWTAEDLRTHQREAIAALAVAYRLDLGALNAFAAKAAEEA